MVPEGISEDATYEAAEEAPEEAGLGVETTLFEFHFQEIFSGERIDMLTGDEVRAQIVAQTRFQTGLAHIERLALRDGEEVSLRIDESNLEATIKVDSTNPFVTVRLTERQLKVESTTTSPGYL